MGVRNHPYWHIIVQAEKKNLNGKYIEKVGLWMPRKTRTIRRGIVLNKHKIRYWLSVGAQPTKGVVRLLNKFEMYPRTPVPWGAANLYEKPDKVYQLEGWRDHFDSKNRKNSAQKYKQMLQEQINVVERQRRIQAEAMDNLGAQQDIELVKTDDIESEEADIFQRVEKFEELNKRFEKHRKEQWKLKGNDLRYNVYLKKMQKLTRMDLGLDIEGYKDYINNLQEFAKYDKDWEILAEDNAKPHYGTMHSIYSEHSQAQLLRPDGPVNQGDLDQMHLEAQAASRCKQLKNTVLKLGRAHYNRLLQQDVDIIEEFEKNPRSFLDFDGDLNIEIKKLYDKRVIQVKERNQMNTYHIETVTDKDLQRCGVSKREFDLIKKLMKLDTQMFAVKEFKDSSPYTYIVDLSKYDNQKIPQDCKEILFRPAKMRTLYERYWAIASEMDKKHAADKLVYNSMRWNSTRYLPKGDDEFILMDKIVEIIDKAVEDATKEIGSIKIDKKKLIGQMEREAKKIARDPPKRFFDNCFQEHAEKIIGQVKDKSFATKSQLEYLALYNEITAIENQYHLTKDDVDGTTILEEEGENSNEQSRRSSFSTKLPQLNVNVLPEELKKKFNMLKKTNLTFQERSDLLSWFVDSMRVQVLAHLDDALQNMDENSKSDLIDELDTLHKKCSDQLFEMHKDNANGELVMDNDHLAGLKRDIQDFKDKIDVVHIEKQRLDMITYHNSKVDSFCKKFDESEAKIEQFLPKFKEIQKEKPDALDEELKNIDVMDPGDAFELIMRVNQKAEELVDEDYEVEIQKLRDEITERHYTAARHGLNYGKLYHGLDGGYSMEKLKTVMKRIKNDIKDNIHPFIDSKEDTRVETQLRKVLKLRIDDRAAQDGEAGEEGEKAEEGEEKKTAQQYLLDEIEEEEEKEIHKELLTFLDERRAKERSEDIEAGETLDEEFLLNDADIEEIQKLYDAENGVHLEDIEDEEEYIDAWLEWIKTVCTIRRKKRTVTYLDKKVAELKAKRPELAEVLDELKGHDYSQSLVGGEWIPDTKNYFKEMDRIEANIGRYPVGFRHYENWQNYTMKYPERTMDDYQIDLNSQITFDEFLSLHKKAFLYECQYNPSVLYQYELDNIDSEDEDDKEKRPQNIIETEEFYQETKNVYAEHVHEKLLAKEWFKKVDAFEMFTNYWSFGRGLHSMPNHNIYVPVTQNIMPRPKFRDYDKEDQLGEDFTYRNKDEHTHARVKVAPSTLKPSPFSPPLQSIDFMRSEMAHMTFEVPKAKWNKDRRLSKSRRKNHQSISMPMKWRFSTSIGLSEEQEKADMEKFNLTQGLNMTIDKSPYSLWNKFAQIIFK